MRATTARPSSLAAARLLPRHTRAARRRERTFALIEDLNGAYFGVIARAAGTAGRRAAVQRARRILAGTRWMSDAAEDAWAYVSRGLEEPTDAFGAAALLTAVAPRGDERVAAWVGTLPAAVRRAVAVVSAPHRGR